MTQLHFNGRREFRNQTTVWTNGKAEVGSGKGQRSEEKKKEDQKRERVRRKKTQVREKGEKSRIPMFFSNDLWFRRVENRLAKAGPSGEMRD